MSGETPRLSALESRKQLLIAECEVHRAQLFQEWDGLTGGVSGLARRARSFGSFASATALLAAEFRAFRRNRAGPAKVRPSRLETVLKAARLGCSVWLMVRARLRS